MDRETSQLLTEAIKLSPVQRVELVDALLESIPPVVETPQVAPLDPAIGQAWGDEVERRIADAQSGRIAMIPRDEALPQRQDDA